MAIRESYVWKIDPKPYLDGTTPKTSIYYRKGMSRKAWGSNRHGPRWLYAIQSIQRGLLMVGQDLPGSTTAAKADGWFGQGTHDALRSYQRSKGLGVDGIFGPNTARTLFRDIIIAEEKERGIPGNYLCGIAALESAYDPGAHALSDKENSFGLVQINIQAHTSWTQEAAQDVTRNIPYAAARMRTAYDAFKGKGLSNELAWKCAICQHNSPLNARLWAESGYPPNEKARSYVEYVQRGG